MLRNLVFVASITLILFTREATTAPSAEKRTGAGSRLWSRDEW